MRSILGRASTVPNWNSPSIVIPKLCLSRISAGRRPPAKPWICNICHHQSKRALHSVRDTSTPRLWTSQREGPKRLQIPRVYISTSKRRLSSSEAQDATKKVREDLPSREEDRRSHISKRFNNVMDHLQSNVFIAGRRLNDLTGYSGIEALKKDIEQQENSVQESRKSLQKAREAYTQAISQRSNSQREVNELLQRKHAWTPDDLERFTALYRSDHANEQSESAAQEKLLSMERKAEEAAAQLSKSILARYHEEQIWSDKIRRMSTWGTWGLMGVNVLLFLVFQIGVEPWRRKRLVKGFEDKVMEALDREGAVAGAGVVQVKTRESITSTTLPTEEIALAATEEALPEATLLTEERPAFQDPDLDLVPELTPEIKTQTSVSTLEVIRETIRDLLSDRQIILRRVDLTTATLEGAAAGVAFVGMLVLLLRPR